MERWYGKVAVVTGSSSGIGAAVSKHLVSYGINVVGLARRKNKLEELQSELKGQQGKFHWIKTDLTKEDEIIAAFQWIESNLNGIDILINNAGISDKGFLAAGKTEDWTEVVNVHILAVNICTREAIKLMKLHGIDGHIINISSVMAHLSTPMPGHATYAGCKRAVEAISAGLRGELLLEKSKIRITVITPGVVKTEIFDLAGIQLPPDYPMLSVNDIAETIIFVLKLPQHAQVTDLCIRPLGENLANAK